MKKYGRGWIQSSPTYDEHKKITILWQVMLIWQVLRLSNVKEVSHCWVNLKCCTFVRKHRLCKNMNRFGSALSIELAKLVWIRETLPNSKSETGWTKSSVSWGKDPIVPPRKALKHRINLPSKNNKNSSRHGELKK